MYSTSVLDCTLRDGGYINNWEFGEKIIKSIITNLEEAKIDIIECGFIRRENENLNSSVFSSMEQLSKVIYPKKENTMYAVMIEFHNQVDDLIPVYDGTGADIVRITFRRNEWKEAKNTVEQLIAKGYLVCVQPVGTATYDDESLLNLIREVNRMKPYAFYLVDTLGMMYRHDMRRFFYLIDNNLARDICLGFHSHNNLQMSFANAQEMLRLANRRNIIVDTSCYGMGRGVGNLATELFTNYINNTLGQRYLLTPILNIVDKYLMPIYVKQRWGYDLPYFLAATVKCHPNYAAHLMKKDTIGIEKIEKILNLLPAAEKNEYNATLIEKLYLDFQKCDFDDALSYATLEKQIGDREVIVMGSGASIKRYTREINKLSENRFLISTNFISNLFSADALFISNDKRLHSMDFGHVPFVMNTSNLQLNISNAIVFNYASLLGEGSASDNAGAMVVRLLKKIGVTKVYLAGFDGFDVDTASSYAIDEFRITMDYDTVMKKNSDISRQLRLALAGVEYEIITPTKYEI